MLTPKGLVTRRKLLHVFFQKRPNQRPEKRPRHDEEAAVEDAAEVEQAGPMDVDQAEQQVVEAQVGEEPGLIGE